jgi:glycosyltransferase involved in cell wall biosynthesis
MVNPGSTNRNMGIIKCLESLSDDCALYDSSDDKIMRSNQSLRDDLKKHIPSHVKRYLSTYFDIAYDKFYTKREIREIIHNFDVVYERFENFHVSGVKEANRANVPIILEVHAPPSERVVYGHPELINKADSLQKYACQNSNAVVTITEVLKDYLAQKYQLDKQRVFVIPNAYEFDARINYSRGSAFQSFDDISGKMIVGFVGGMQPYSGVPFLIRTMARIVEQIPNSHLFLVGPFTFPPVKEECEQIIEDLGLHEYVTMTGYVEKSNLPSIYEIIDVCVIPNGEWYGLPTKLLEYGGFGKAVVAAAVDGIREVISSPEFGLVFEQGSVQEFSDNIIYLLTNPDVRQKLGINLSRRVASDFSWKQNLIRMQRLFKTMAVNDRDVLS